MVIFICNLSVSSVQMSAMKAANKDLKGTMKTLKIDDIDVWRFLFFILFLHFFQLLQEPTQKL